MVVRFHRNIHVNTNISLTHTNSARLGSVPILRSAACIATLPERSLRGALWQDLLWFDGREKLYGSSLPELDGRALLGSVLDWGPKCGWGLAMWRAEVVGYMTWCL